MNLSAHLRALEPTLRVLSQAALDHGVVADIVLMIYGRPLGSLMDLTAADVSRIASANCGVVLDVYSDSDV